MGPIAVDQSGNGYVAWLNASGSTDIDMFCKLCEAVKGSCRASAMVTAKGAEIGTGSRRVRSGMTKTLVVDLNGRGASLLRVAHHRLKATLKLVIANPGSKSERLTVSALLLG